MKLFNGIWRKFQLCVVGTVVVTFVLVVFVSVVVVSTVVVYIVVVSVFIVSVSYLCVRCPRDSHILLLICLGWEGERRVKRKPTFGT